MSKRFELGKGDSVRGNVFVVFIMDDPQAIDMGTRSSHHKRLAFDLATLLRMPVGHRREYRECDDVGKPPRLRHVVSDEASKVGCLEILRGDQNPNTSIF